MWEAVMLGIGMLAACYIVTILRNGMVACDTDALRHKLDMARFNAEQRELEARRTQKLLEAADR